MDAATLDAASTGVIAPAAGDGGSPTPAAPGATEQGPQAGAPGAPAAPAATEDLNLTDRERAFLAGLKDEREKRQETDRQLQEALARANQFAAPAPQPAAPVAPQPAPAPADPFAGLDDDEIMTAKDVKDKIVPFFMGMLQQVAGAVAVSQRQAQYTDVTPDDMRTFIPKIMQEDPAIGQVLSQLPGPAQFMMAQVLTRLAKRGATGQAPASPGMPAAAPAAAPAADPLVDIARTILANAQKPGAPGSAGGGAMDDVVSLLRNMTPEQYEAYRAEKRKSMGL